MSGRWVLDASAAVRVVMRSEDTEALIERLEHASLIIAPSLYCSETANAIWKYVRAGHIPRATGVERCEEALHLIDRFIPDCELQTEAFALAAQNDHPVYDTMYCVLARRNAAGVITFDKRLIGLLSKLNIDSA